MVVKQRSANAERPLGGSRGRAVFLNQNLFLAKEHVEHNCAVSDFCGIKYTHLMLFVTSYPLSNFTFR